MSPRTDGVGQTSPMVIREATDGDLEIVTALRLKFLAEHRSVDPGDLSESFSTMTRDFLRRQSAAETIRTWIASENRIDIGLVTMLLLDLAPRPEDASGIDGYIVNMYVEPKHRSCGTGTKLLAACLATAQEKGLRRLLLHATTDGQSLYEDAGFVTNPNWMELPL